MASVSRALLGETEARGLRSVCVGLERPMCHFLVSHFAKSSVLSSGASEPPLVEQLPEPITDLAKVLREVRPVEGSEQVGVRVVIKHVSDAVV